MESYTAPGPTNGPVQALEVTLPDDPPTLTERGARTLLTIIKRAAEQRRAPDEQTECE